MSKYIVKNKTKNVGNIQIQYLSIIYLFLKFLNDESSHRIEVISFLKYLGVGKWFKKKLM